VAVALPATERGRGPSQQPATHRSGNHCNHPRGPEKSRAFLLGWVSFCFVGGAHEGVPGVVADPRPARSPGRATSEPAPKTPGRPRTISHGAASGQRHTGMLRCVRSPRGESDRQAPHDNECRGWADKGWGGGPRLRKGVRPAGEGRQAVLLLRAGAKAKGERFPWRWQQCRWQQCCWCRSYAAVSHTHIRMGHSYDGAQSWQWTSRSQQIVMRYSSSHRCTSPLHLITAASLCAARGYGARAPGSGWRRRGPAVSSGCSRPPPPSRTRGC
jgi:hypothetical protein